LNGPPPPPVADWGSYRRLLPYIVPYWRGLFLVLAISVLSTMLGLAQPYLSKLMIDQALLRRDMGALLLIAGVMVAVTVLGFGVNILASYRYVRLSAAMLYDIRAALLRHLQTLSPRFYASFRLGDLVSRMNSDVSDVQRIASDTLLSVVSNLLFFVGCVAMMLWLDWRLFLVGGLLVPASLGAFVHYQRRLTVLTRDMRERGADLGSLLVDTVMGMRVVAALRAGEHEVGRFKAKNDAFVGAMLKMQIASYMTGALPGTVMTGATSAVILYGGWRIIEGEVSIGTLVAFMTYHMRLLSPIQTLMGLTSGLASARVSLARIFELFDTRPEVMERAEAVAIGPVRQGICFDRVELRYDRDAVLCDVNLTVQAGTLCAIVGPSGVGKSTMADLMVRYLDPCAGRILIDGHDLREIRLDNLRRQIMLVDQSPWMFNDSIAANIAFALPDARTEDIEAAAHAAGLDAFLARLPEGLATRAGERGLALSAGERQRVVIARALLRRPSVLILDEPTSALDGDTEALVAGRLRGALPDATIIVITHKPALAQIADQVVTIVNGQAHVSRQSTMDTDPFSHLLDIPPPIHA
jgi:ATP-binding cassette subfamily B protein